MNRLRILPGALVLALIAAFVFLTVSSSVRESATYDEPAHLAAGYSYLRWHDYRMNPEHPPLLKELAALPLLALPVWPATVEAAPDTLSTNSVALRALQSTWALGLADDQTQWFFSHYLLYGVTDAALQRTGATHPLLVPTSAPLAAADFPNDADRLLFWGRWPITVLGALLALLIFCWTRELFGTAGGLLALTLYCFDPNFIAHSGLVTTDVGVAVFMFGTMYCLWRTCRRMTALNIALLALFFGLAIAAKFSAILLGPVILLVTLIWIFATTRPATGVETDRYHFPRLIRMPAFGGVLLVAGLVAYGLLWATYGFRYSAARDPARTAAVETVIAVQAKAKLPANREPGYFPLESVLRRSAAIHWLQEIQPRGALTEQAIQDAMHHVELRRSGALLLFARKWHLLPEAYLYGFAYAEMRSLSRGSYLLGEHSDRGWWYYFPVAFLLKTPTLTLFVLGVAIVYLIRRRRVSWVHLLFLLAPVLAYVAVSLGSHLNIGHRHLLPVYPFLFVLCGSLGLIRRVPGRRIVGPVLLGAIALNSFVVFAPPWRPALVYPHYLAYFNEFAGGPRDGYRRLADSNVDWGQNLKSLKHWLDAHQIQAPINLCYFGTADPRSYHIPHANLPGSYAFAPETPWNQVRVPGYFIISATYRQGVYQSPQLHLIWQEILKQATLIDTIGYSLFIYYHY